MSTPVDPVPSHRPGPGRRRRGGLLAVVMSMVVAAIAVLAASAPASAAGALTIDFHDAGGQRVSGACYDVWTEVDDDFGELVRSLCNTTGQNTLNLPAGRYRIWEMQAPLIDAASNSHLYRKAPITPVTITEGGTSNVVLVHQIGAALDITAVLPDGSPAPGSCFDATIGGQQVADACAPSGANTVALIVPAATQLTLNQVSGPDGFGPAPSRALTTPAADARQALTMTMTAGGRLEVTQRSGSGAVVAGGCYSFYLSPSGGSEQLADYVCDGDDAGVDGVVVLAPATGRFRVVEEQAPTGYRLNAEPFFVTVAPGATERVDRAHQALAVLRAVTVAAGQQPLTGSCWMIHVPGEYEGVVAEGCDDGDGANDGTWTVPDLPAGAYELRHLSTPGYERLGQLQPFEIDADDVTLTYELGPLRAPVNVTGPTVTGNVAVGAALTAGDGTWTGSEPMTYRRQWESCDAAGANCSAIPDQRATTFTPTAAFAGRTFRVAVTADNDGGSATARSAVTAALVVSPPVSATPPTVTGTVAVGAALTGANGTWTGDAAQFAAAWLRCDGNGESCTAIAGATGTTYTPVTADAGARLRYQVTASNAGGTVTARSAATVAVPGSAPELLQAPQIVRILAFYTGTPGEWRSTNGAITYAYQWLRCDLAGNACRPIDGATLPILGRDNRFADVSLRLSVTATNAGGSTEARSEPFVLGPDNRSAPMLSGNARVGDVLTASTGIWSPTTGISQYIYTWLRCDANGASCYALHGYAVASNTYRLTAEDVGKTIRIDVNARNGDAGRRSARSSATAVITRHPPTALTPPTLAGEPRLGATLTATSGAWASDRPIDQTAYLWLRCDANGANCYALHNHFVSSNTYRPTTEDLGRTIRVRLFARNADGTTESANSAATAVIAKYPPTNTTPPTLTGVPQIGNVLTSSTGTWATDRQITSYAYTWLRCDANGANCYALHGYAIASNTYRLTAEDVGKTIRIDVYARHDEGGSRSPYSPPTPVIID